MTRFSEPVRLESTADGGGTVDGAVCIDCATCVRQETSTCEDCVVTFLVNRQPSEAVVIDVAEFAALRRLQTAGLVPELKHQAGAR